MTSMRFKLRLAIHGAALSCASAFACGEAGVEDEKPLRTLSASELGELCDEVQSAWPSSDDSIECGDGSTVTFLRPPRATCGDVDFSECPATVGELRSCARALTENPCSALQRLPEACEQLEQAGCGDASTGGELAAICPEAPAEQLTAFEGIYELVSHTASGPACAYEGDSVLAVDLERMFVVVAGSVLGRPVSVLESCSELAGCRQRGTEIRQRLGSTEVELVLSPLEAVPELHRSFTCRADSPGAVLAQASTVGRGPDDRCELTTTETTMTRVPRGLRLESRTFAWQKPVLDDACSYVAGEQPGDAPCIELEMLEALWVAAL
jgi:hypothetical protein